MTAIIGAYPGLMYPGQVYPGEGLTDGAWSIYHNGTSWTARRRQAQAFIEQTAADPTTLVALIDAWEAQFAAMNHTADPDYTINRQAKVKIVPRT